MDDRTIRAMLIGIADGYVDCTQDLITLADELWDWVCAEDVDGAVTFTVEPWAS